MLVVDGNKTAFNRNKCVRVTVKQNVSYQSQYVNILFCRFDSIYYCSTVQQKMLPSGQHRYRSLAAETSGTMGVDLSEIINVTPSLAQKRSNFLDRFDQISVGGWLILDIFFFGQNRKYFFLGGVPWFRLLHRSLYWHFWFNRSTISNKKHVCQ